MQPLQYNSRHAAAKDNGITQTAAAARNVDAAITLRSAAAELLNTIELRTTAPEIAAPKLGLGAKAKKHDFEAQKKIIKGKAPTPNYAKT